MDSIVYFLSSLLGSETRVFFTGLFTSQIISNVPAAVLLSTFTDGLFAKALLQGVNVGSMGTLIASLASLISFKYILRDYPSQAKNYIVKYSLISLFYISLIT
jgi:Na+/H+ antiporter NhaD/arsenite permease-like protein